jgi:predicted hydrocarbon binding protein
MRIKSVLSGVLAGLMVAAPSLWAVDSTATKVTEGDQVQFQQKAVGAMVQELQERMFRLAEMTKEAEPEDAAKLLMAVRRAREQLIVEQIKDVVEQLGKDLGKATDEQKQVLVKLEELKKLLLSTDLDLAMQIERLRQLQAAIKKLDENIKEEKRQEGETGKLADKTEPKKLDDAKKDQEQNRNVTNAVAQMARDLGQYGSKAVPALQAGAQSMSSAEGSLGAGQPKNAQGQQGEAVASLKQAREELEQAKQKLLAEIEKQVRAQVMENLMAMLDRQKAVRGATEALQARVQMSEREALLRVKQLAGAEQRVADVADQTVQLIEETQFSVALPPILRNIQRRCIYVTADLQAGRGGPEVVSAEKQIEQDISELLETFKTAYTPSSAGNSQCKSCGGNKNKLLAELKVVRLLQIRVNQETQDEDMNRAKVANLSADLKDKIISTHDIEGQVRDATEKLHQMTCPDCLNE